MHSRDWIFLLFVSVINLSVQQPTFFKATFKGLNGLTANLTALSNDEMRVAYYHEQTVAIVDLNSNNELRACNIIEVYEPSEAIQVLRNLFMTLRPQAVSFQEMIKLMQQCDTLYKSQIMNISPTSSTDTLSKGTRLAANSITLLSGILPGTKWCGTGDIAESYDDLGDLPQIDRCCRNHDLCPIKVRARRTRYNLTNYSLYTKSHCTCDKILYQCLKIANHTIADLMGQIYFNIVKIPCIVDTGQKHQLISESLRQFVPVEKRY